MLFLLLRSFKKKIKTFTLPRAMQAERSRGIAILFLWPRQRILLGGRSHIQLLIRGKETVYLLQGRLCGLQDRYERMRKTLSPHGFELQRSILQPDAKEIKTANYLNIVFLLELFFWRYNPLWLHFHSPVAGFSLLLFEVSWSHATTRHSR